MSTTTNPSKFTICFQLPGGGGGGGTNKRHVCQVDASSCTVQDLYKTAASATGTTAIELKFGFPPQTLDRTCCKTLTDVGIQNQERIMVTQVVVKEVVEVDKTASNNKKTKKTTATKGKKGGTAKKKQEDDDNEKKEVEDNDKDQDKKVLQTSSPSHTTTSNNSSNSRRRPRRKAAEIATESFAETIQQQDKLLKEQQQKKKKKGTTTPMSEETKQKLATARHFRNLEKKISSPRSSSSSSSTKRKQAGGTTGGTSMEEALVGATSSNNRSARLLRKGWKNAVHDMYEQNQAVARLAAIQANTVQYTTLPKNTTTTTTTLQVKYPKGIQGRKSSYYQDTIEELISLEAIQAVISSIHPNNTEALRPSNLALLSPRVLWSLLYHYTTKNNNNNNNDNNDDNPVAAALQWSCPNLNWKFLKRRKQQLSLKARENLKQAQTQNNNETTENDWEAAAMAIASVEQAMERMDSSTTNNTTVVQSLRRYGNTQMVTKLDWKIMTPDEPDLDELIECIVECDYNHQTNTTTTTATSTLRIVDKTQAESLAKLFLNETCQIYNWRQLANANADDIFLRRFHPKDDTTTTNTTTTTTTSNLTLDQIESWIDYAQEQSVQEIIVEICNGNVQAVEMLRDYVNSGTPKDLAVWTVIVEDLYKELLDKCSTKEEEEDDDDDKQLPSKEELQLWCQRSQLALEQFEWLNWYATPVA